MRVLATLALLVGVADAGKCDNFPTRGRAVMTSCCSQGPGGGHRRLQNCRLPNKCPSVACAKTFTKFVDDCQSWLAVMPGNILNEYKQLNKECLDTLEAAPSTTITNMPRGFTTGTRLKCGAKACEYRYTNIQGTKVADLIKAPVYPLKPSSTVKMTKGTFSMSAKGDNLGVMMEGFVMAPTSGAYTFSTFSDDSSQVWVGTKPNTQRSVVLAVQLDGCCRKVAGTTTVTWKKGQTYYIRAYLKEGGGGEYCRVGMTVAGKEYYPIPLTLFRSPGSFKAPPGMTGGTALRCGAPVCEYQYSGIKGTSVESLTSSGRFPRRPNKIVKLQGKGTFSMTMRGDNLGVMMEGFVQAPLTGRYTFSTRSDDASELWVAQQPNSQKGLVKVVELRGCCRKVQGVKPVKWTKGKTYYIRYLVKEGGGVEYGQVGMKVGAKEWFPIPLSVFKRLGGVTARVPKGLTRGPRLKCGAAACEYLYTGIGGTRVEQLTASKKYPLHPDNTIAIRTGTFSMQSKGNNLGVLLEGFVMAPVDGMYTFSTRSDDSSQVWVATRPNTQTRLQLAVELRGCCRKVSGKRAFAWKAKRTYYIRALVKEGGGGEYLQVGMTSGTKEWFPIPISAFAKAGAHTAPPPPPGVPRAPAGITKGVELKCGAPLCEYRYSGIPGSSIQSLTSAPQYPLRPSATVRHTRGTFSMSSKGDNFGAMMEGFYLAPVTGTYTFSTRSDDASVVYVARQPNTQGGLVKVVELTGCCRKVQGTTQVKWHKGDMYYIRAAVKEQQGGEYLYVGVTVGGKEYFPIPATQFRIPEGGSSTGQRVAAPGMTSGTVLRCGAAVCEYQYTNIKGTKVRDLIGSPKFPRHPDKIVKVTAGNFEMSMKGDNIGVMMEGFIRAPVSGSYSFSTRSDDSSAVWAAPSPMSQKNLVRVVYLDGCCRKVQGTKKLAWQAGQNYYIRAYVKEGGGGEYGQVGMKTGAKEWFPIPIAAFVKAGTATTAPGPSTGTQLSCGAAACEYQYAGIGGTSVSDLLKSKKFPRSPDKVVPITSSFQMQMKGNNLGVMMEGFVVAPASGSFIFETRSDDSSEVWVARRPMTQTGLTKVAELRGCCRKVIGKKKIEWQAGQAYYIRAYVKEGGGGEYGQFGFKAPNGKEYFPIPASMFRKL